MHKIARLIGTNQFAFGQNRIVTSMLPKRMLHEWRMREIPLLRPTVTKMHADVLSLRATPLENESLDEFKSRIKKLFYKEVEKFKDHLGVVISASRTYADKITHKNYLYPGHIHCLGVDPLGNVDKEGDLSKRAGKRVMYRASIIEDERLQQVIDPNKMGEAKVTRYTTTEEEIGNWAIFIYNNPADQFDKVDIPLSVFLTPYESLQISHDVYIKTVKTLKERGEVNPYVLLSMEHPTVPGQIVPYANCVREVSHLLETILSTYYEPRQLGHNPSTQLAGLLLGSKLMDIVQLKNILEELNVLKPGEEIPRLQPW